jgi:hypothetical protein
MLSVRFIFENGEKTVGLSFDGINKHFMRRIQKSEVCEALKG